ncbi:ABC transporter permease [Bacillus cereus]|uniref:ABC transporter permease n=1 Tax=Bacillus cereus TaxID=1396 RepID=UPI003079E4B9
MFLAWKELKRNKMRYGLIAVMMILLSFLVVMITGLANGLSYDNASFIKTTKMEHFVLSDDAEKKLLRSSISESDEKAMTKGFEEKEYAPLHINMSTLTKEKDGKKVDVTVVAGPNVTNVIPDITEGKNIKGNSEIVVDEKLKKKGIKISDKLQDPISKQVFTVVGFTKNASFSHTGIAFMNKESWDKIALPNQKEFNTIAFTKQPSVKDSKWEIVSKKELLQNIPGYKEEQGTLMMIVGFLLTISALLIATFFYVITLQKVKQIGVLKAIGTSNRILTMSLVWQSILISAFSFVISGISLFGVQQIMPESMPFLLENTTILLFGCVFVVISIFGTCISLIPILKVHPLEAIGGNE